MAKILITESVHPIGPELLTAAGHTVVYADRDMDVIRREIVDADAVLVRIIELPGSLLATAKNLKIVSKHGVGYDNIDLDYCKSHGVAVTITPNANSLSVAEHAFTLMLTLAKNIIPVSNEYRTVGFAAKNHAPGIEMTGKTLGLIGMGRIGKHVLHMCKDGLDMHVIVYDPYISEVPEGVEKVDDLSELLRRADVVTLHCLLTDETRKLIDRERLALMKPTALLINCARGPIVDEAALIEALENGRLAGAVFAGQEVHVTDLDDLLAEIQPVNQQYFLQLLHRHSPPFSAQPPPRAVSPRKRRSEWSAEWQSGSPPDCICLRCAE